MGQYAVVGLDFGVDDCAGGEECPQVVVGDGLAVVQEAALVGGDLEQEKHKRPEP